MIRRRRSQTVRQKKRDDQREQGRRSRSLPRDRAQSLTSWLPEGGVEVRRSGEGARERKRREREEEQEDREEKDDSITRHARHSGSSGAAQRASFSFLMPMDEFRRHSDSESAGSFSEVSQSAASIATAGWREHSFWTRDESSWQQGDAPGPWLKPSPNKLTQVLTGSRLRRRELLDGLSL